MLYGLHNRRIGICPTHKTVPFVAVPSCLSAFPNITIT